MADLPALRVVLLGKTGSGKSSLGNTLFGRGEIFRVVNGMLSGSDKCQWADGVFEDLGITLQVTDTPGACDTHRTEVEVLIEIGKSVAVSSPGPHVILMVLRCDKRFTQEEYLAYKTLKEMFGPEIRRHMVLVFCGADGLGGTRELQKAKFEENLQQCSPQLLEVMTDANGRCFCINNNAIADELKSQASELLQMMQELVKENGGLDRYYTSELNEDVQRLVEPLVRDTMSQQNKTRAEAIHETNKAILDESVPPDFWASLNVVITKSLMPSVQLVVSKVAMMGAKLVVKFVAAKCSVM